MRAARALVERAAHGASEHTYGINTGFGRFVSRSIPEELTEELQRRLLRSHACGVGDPYPPELVRAAMLLRANALAKGNSGARVATVELLIECLNRGLLPQVPSRGSVGASGDLAPLAHLALLLIGEGAAWFDGELLPGDEALGRAGLEPIRLQAKEGLSPDLGARVATVELLIECLNRGLLPQVPSRGSVGASGDLAPLAHIALPLIGEGAAWFDGELLPGDEALGRAGLEPIRLQAKEGLS